MRVYADDFRQASERNAVVLARAAERGFGAMSPPAVYDRGVRPFNPEQRHCHPGIVFLVRQPTVDPPEISTGSDETGDVSEDVDLDHETRPGT